MSSAIVITNYNYGKFVATAVKSALAQTIQPEVIIVVDDKSTDNSLETLKGFGNQVVIIRQSENKGLSAARNTGLRYLAEKHPNVSYVGFLDADDYYEPSKLEKSVAILEKLPFVLGVYSDYYEYDLRTNKTRREFKHPFDLNLFRQACIISTNSVFRVQPILAAGGYNETWPNCEDYELYSRMINQGIFWHLAEPLFTYRLHGKNITIEKRDEVLHRTGLVRQRLAGVKIE